ncbi:MAG: winged helix-turn-helix domain-containing protein [Candidatus Diapherotrites archaeon]|nr:winged helix-turn-helix domain-containing protein [Candidatus Micrarchaeota archaeon]MBU1939611.1 winged helix-turn-helix domain-containing protein [Candidatus Micrarchaeota archaeon]
MLSRTQIRILEEIVKKGRNSLKELAAALNLGPSTISEALTGLRKEGFLAKGSSLSENAHAQHLANLMRETPYSFEFLAGANLKVMIALLEPKTAWDVAFSSGYSRAQVFKTFRTLRKHGLLKEKKREYSLADTIPGLRDFLSAYLVFSLPAKGLPASVKVLKRFRNGGMLVMAPKGTELPGEKTSFSRLGEFGIGLSSNYDYYFLPKKKLSIGEIFTHSLHSAASVRERLLCVLFYIKNGKKLVKNPQIESVLSGRKLRGWPSRNEIEEAALQYGLSLRRENAG